MDQRIVHFASEAVPFSKTGGLADVLGALPGAEAALGCDVTVVVPAHRAVADVAAPGEAIGVVEALGLHATVRESRHAGARVLLLDCPALFVRPAPYSLAGSDYPDNAMRFAFLVRAGLNWLVREGGVDVVHVHDWQAALAPVLLRHDPILADALGNPRTILTIHNLAYQGVFPPWTVAACGLDAALFTVEALEFWGKVNFLKGGILCADAVTTVSPTYASEILTPEFGCGLDGVLDRRSDVLTGILNGLDVDLWDPASDSHLPVRFNVASAATGKRAAGATLRHELGLASTGRPLIGIVSRLIEQKGADIVAAAVDDIVAAGFDLVILGTGDRRFEDAFLAAQLAHPGVVRTLVRFDERLAHLIYAASDLFLMPSRFEPCGLGQMIAMRYGSLPVVRATGGLSDTVVDASSLDGCGFCFNDATPTHLLAALGRARHALADRTVHTRLRDNAMARDFTWDTSARAYLDLYQQS